MYLRPLSLLAAIFLCSVLCPALPRRGVSGAVAPYPSLLAPREVRAGVLSSPKGAGPAISVQTFDSIVHSFTILADLGGVATQEMDRPGWKLMWNVDNVLFSGVSRSEPLMYSLYVGHGVSMGHVRDFNRDGKGWMGALCLDAGCCLSFERRLSICFQFDFEYGLILTGGGAVVSAEPTGRNLGFYRNGIFRCYVPQIKIMYSL